MSVIYCRAPLRLPLGGGGTDLPSYYEEFGGFLISGALDKYVYMFLHTNFQKKYLMKYSQTEEVDNIAELKHPILRETLLRHWSGSPLEIASVADVPSGTGMGSSGAYTVCLIKALAHARRRSITPAALAEAACHIEIDVLREPVGKQDQYVAAHGGICAYTFHKDGRVEVEPLELASETMRRLRDHLLLFYTGDTRAASGILADQDDRSRRRDPEMIENLHRTKEMGFESRRLLEAEDLDGYAALLDEHWRNKRRRSPGMANQRVDAMYQTALDSGALGGKLVGAGGGGFLLVFSPHPEDTRAALAPLEAAEMTFDFECGGATSTEYA